MEQIDLALLCEATAALVRLDERLGHGPTAVRAGWLARALLHEASASARLDEVYVEADDLLLFEYDLLPRLTDHDVHAAHRGLVLLRAAARRDPRQLFTPRRLAAAARLRFRSPRGGRDRDDRSPRQFLEQLQDRRAEPEEIRASLGRALDPSALQTFRIAPALLGAADFLARWHDSGAAASVGGVTGRALAAAWPRRAGLVSYPVPLPAIGFLGHAAEYGLRRSTGWGDVFLSACLRGAEWGGRLHDRLSRADRRLRQEAPARRTTSHLPALADLLVSSPGVTAQSLARALEISPTAIRSLLRTLQDRGLLQELTGRGSFRLFSAI